MPRFIPKLAFQIFAITLLVASFAVMIYWIVTGSGVYRLIDEMINGRSPAAAMLLTFFVVFIGWVIVVLPIRRFSQMPTMKEDLGADLGDGLPAVWRNAKHVLDAESAKNEAMYRAKTYTPEMRKRARALGGAFVLIGFLLALAGVWLFFFTVESGLLSKFQIALLIFAPSFFVIGLYQLISGKSAVRK